MIGSARRSLLLAAPAVLAGCATPGGVGAGREAPLPRLRVGDRWRYRVVDRYRDQVVDQPVLMVTALAPELVLSVSGRGGAAAEERYAEPWMVLQETIFGEIVRYDSAVPLVPLPTSTGSGVTTVTTWRSPDDGRPRRWTQRLSVGGWESVEVPAGRFDCLRIERVIAFDHRDTNRSASSRSDRLWYSPEARRWVRREWRGEYTSAGIGAGSAAEGTRGTEDWVAWELAAWLPTPAAA